MALTLDMTQRYTYADYLTWLDDVRRELVDGFIKLFPAPHYDHSIVTINTVNRLLPALVGNDEYRLLQAPVDVLLSENTVVQPDILICKKSQLYDGKCNGAPLFIAEILSKSNRKHDLITKFQLYEKYGVEEYWIVNPKGKIVSAYFLQENGEYDNGEDYTITESIPLKTLNGFCIESQLIFNI